MTLFICLLGKEPKFLSGQAVLLLIESCNPPHEAKHKILYFQNLLVQLVLFSQFNRK